MGLPVDTTAFFQVIYAIIVFAALMAIKFIWFLLAALVAAVNLPLTCTQQTMPGNSIKTAFLPRDAMLAQYMPSSSPSCVCVCVCVCLEMHLYDLLCICCKLVRITCRQQITRCSNFEPNRACTNVLITDSCRSV